MIFKLYGEDLHNIQALYEKHKDQPPIPRNMTRIAGNIHWSRQLLRRITSPMKKFQENPRVFFPRDSKKIVRHYNKGQSLPASHRACGPHSWRALPASHAAARRCEGWIAC